MASIKFDEKNNNKNVYKRTNIFRHAINDRGKQLALC